MMPLLRLLETAHRLPYLPATVLVMEVFYRLTHAVNLYMNAHLSQILSWIAQAQQAL